MLKVGGLLVVGCWTLVVGYSSMDDLIPLALEASSAAGASYSDIRLQDIRSQDLLLRNGSIGTLTDQTSAGFGVRVLVDGAWGFASSHRLEKDEVARITALAVAAARAAAARKGPPVRLAPVAPAVASWRTPCTRDPFAVPLEEKLDLLRRVDRILRAKPEIVVAESGMSFQSRRQTLATSEGSRIDQTLVRSGAGYSATASGHGDTQTRSYPLSLGGQNVGGGYEAVASLGLVENAERVRDQAITLLTAEPCPSGTFDLILDSTQLALQIHESAGHPSELDRVLGIEESLAGRSFLTLEKRGAFRYGSPLVTLMADGTLPGGVATYAYDDDGVPAKRYPIVERGTFVNYATNREFWHQAGLHESGGTCRAEGWNRLPMIRIPNLSLQPGRGRLEDLIADTKDGILMSMNRSWSIDQLRYNFQFGCEIGWRIRNGKRAGLLKNPTYQGITPEFWGSCDAVCGPEEFGLWGVVNCGKGHPMQRGEMSHGAAPARFRKVRAGIA